MAVYFVSSYFAAFVTYYHLIVSTALSLNNNKQPIRSTDNDVVTRQQLLQQSSSLFSATTAAAILAASTTRPANAAASTATTSTAGGGLARRLSSRDPGQLTNRIFNIPPKTPQIYPPFARGVWEVAMTFSGYTFPSTTVSTNQLISNSDVPGFQKLSIAMIGDVGKATSSYILDVDTSTGYENRILSYTSSITSHLGYNAVREIKYNPKDNSPNRLSIDFIPQRTRNANHIELYYNARESELQLSESPSIFVCSEHIRQVTFSLSREYGIARQVIGNYAHYWTWKEEDTTTTTDAATKRMTGNLLTAVYLDAQDPLYFNEPSKPIVVYSHDLVAMKKRS